MEKQMNAIFKEVLHKGLMQEVTINKVLIDKKSKYQRIQILDTSVYGRILVLDGIIQITEKDEDGNLINIYLEKASSGVFQVTHAKKGVFKYEKNFPLLILYDGQTTSSKGNNISNFKFSKSNFNLSSFDTRTIKVIKTQETSSINLIKCVRSLSGKNYKENLDSKISILSKKIITTNSIAVHIRGGDMEDDSNYTFVEDDYYFKAINFFEKKYGKISLNIMTDDIDLARKQISKIIRNKEIDIFFFKDLKLTDVEEFLLFKSHKNFIISRSGKLPDISCIK